MGGPAGKVEDCESVWVGRVHVDIVKTDECAFVVDCLVCVHFSTYYCTWAVCPVCV